jgi:hypothetical protein
MEIPAVLFVKDRAVDPWYAISTGDFIDGGVKNYVDIENPTGKLTIACDGIQLTARYFLIFEFRLDIGQLISRNMNKWKMLGEDSSDNRTRVIINRKNLLDTIENENGEWFSLNSPEPAGLSISLSKSRVFRQGGSNKINISYDDKTKLKKSMNNNDKHKKDEKARLFANENSRIIRIDDFESSESSD